MLVQSDEDIEKILEAVIQIQKSEEENKRKQELDNYIKQIREKVFNRKYRMNYELYLNPPNLHKVVRTFAPLEIDFKTAIALIKNGASLEERDQFGATPLINAAIAGNNVASDEQDAVGQFFKDNCKVDFSKESDLLASLNDKKAGSEASLNKEEEPSIIMILTLHRSKLFGNNNNSNLPSPDLFARNFTNL